MFLLLILIRSEKRNESAFYDNLSICEVIIYLTISLRLIFFKILKSGNSIKSLKEYQSVQKSHKSI